MIKAVITLFIIAIVAVATTSTFFPTLLLSEQFSTPCEAILARAFDSAQVTTTLSSNVVGATSSSYTGLYGQPVMFSLPGANNMNLMMLADGTPGFASKPYNFFMEYNKPNPKFTIANRVPGVVYLTDYFFIKTSDSKYITKLPNDYRYTMTNDASAATPFYLFQKHSMYYNHNHDGYIYAEKNDVDDGLRYMHAIVTNIHGPGQDIQQNGWQWKPTSDQNHFVDNTQSQWNTFTYTLS